MNRRLAQAKAKRRGERAPARRDGRGGSSALREMVWTPMIAGRPAEHSKSLSLHKMRMAGGEPGHGDVWCRVRSGFGARGSLFRQQRDAREEEVTSYPDQDEIGQQDERPAEIMANDFAFVADEFAGGNTDAGSLRRDWLADLRAHRV